MIIVALTSYSDRLLYAHIALTTLMKPNQTKEADKYVLTIYKDDIDNLSKNSTLMKLMLENKLEIIIAPEDLKNNNKYYWVMQKYDQDPIILVDDDLIYPDFIINNLYNSYLENPKCASGYCCRMFDTRNLIDSWYNPSFYFKYEIKKPNINLLAEGYAGVIYPPSINFKQNIERIMPLIRKFYELQKHDDLVLHFILKLSNISMIPLPHSQISKIIGSCYESKSEKTTPSRVFNTLGSTPNNIICSDILGYFLDL